MNSVVFQHLLTILWLQTKAQCTFRSGEILPQLIEKSLKDDLKSLQGDRTSDQQHKTSNIFINLGHFCIIILHFLPVLGWCTTGQVTLVLQFIYQDPLEYKSIEPQIFPLSFISNNIMKETWLQEVSNMINLFHAALLKVYFAYLFVYLFNLSLFVKHAEECFWICSSLMTFPISHSVSERE